MEAAAVAWQAATAVVPAAAARVMGARVVPRAGVEVAEGLRGALREGSPVEVARALVASAAVPAAAVAMPAAAVAPGMGAPLVEGRAHGRSYKRGTCSGGNCWQGCLGTTRGTPRSRSRWASHCCMALAAAARPAKAQRAAAVASVGARDSEVAASEAPVTGRAAAAKAGGRNCTHGTCIGSNCWQRC